MLEHECQSTKTFFGTLVGTVKWYSTFRNELCQEEKQFIGFFTKSKFCSIQQMNLIDNKCENTWVSIRVIIQ